MKSPELDSEHVIVECDCFSMDHLVRVSYWPDKEQPAADELLVTTHMQTGRSLWRRLAEAVRHIFKIDGRHGQWDEVLMSPESAAKLIPILQVFVERRNAYKTAVCESFEEKR